MPLLLNFPWIKLPRDTLPPGKGLMGAWARLASRAAFRAGQANYCGHRNEVELASWVGGIVGLKSILGIGNKQKALTVMEQLAQLGYISFSLNKSDGKLSYTIKDWVVKCSGAPCSDGAIYATEGYGFLCLPRNITQRLVEAKHKFEESDAWLDLWCHTVWQDFRNAFSYGRYETVRGTVSRKPTLVGCPVVQFGRDGAALTLENLGARWGWEKTKVWRDRLRPIWEKYATGIFLTRSQNTGMSSRCASCPAPMAVWFLIRNIPARRQPCPQTRNLYVFWTKYAFWGKIRILAALTIRKSIE